MCSVLADTTLATSGRKRHYPRLDLQWHGRGTTWTTGLVGHVLGLDLVQVIKSWFLMSAYALDVVI